jgi:uncharacterized PurR-regulated membrane protein YhhQ (DUF165 family)
MKRTTLTALALTTYAGSVPIANWMISNVGTQQFPDGPHTIPVGFGFDAPSGVLAIGVALAARDAVHRLAGHRVAVIAIVAGVALSFFLASPALAAASAVAFALGETLDLAVYVPLARRRLALAVLASGTVGAVVDSVVFLNIAFGSSMFWQGQVIGKMWVTGLAALAVLGVQCFISQAPGRLVSGIKQR